MAPNVVGNGDSTTVIYKGLLRNSGADAVYLHMGYGDDWKEKKDIKMQRTAEGFEANLNITSHDSLCFAFKDSAGNWDNNSGRNYKFEVQER